MHEWCGPPIMAGNWKDLSAGEAMDVIRAFASSPAHGAPGTERDYTLEAVRAMPLSCYPGSLLLEVQAHVPAAGARGLMNLIYAPSGMVMLDGRSIMLHRLNAEPGRLSIAQEDKAREFVILFCNVVRGEEGRFQTILHQHDLLYQPGASMDAEILAAIPEGFTLTRNEADNGWETNGPILFGDTVFHSRFTLDDDGMIKMLDDNPIGDPPPIRLERWHKQFRIPPQEQAS